MTPEQLLVDAARKYREAGSHRGLQLEAILYSVGASIRLLEVQHDRNALAPLEYLRAALARLASGRQDPVLQPLREPGRAGRPGPDGALLAKQVYILFAWDMLRRAGWKKGRADKFVAEVASELGLTGADGGPVSEHMIRNWRSLLNTKPMKAVAKELEPRLVQMPDLDPTVAPDAVRALLAEAAKIEGIEISKNPPLT